MVWRGLAKRVCSAALRLTQTKKLSVGPEARRRLPLLRRESRAALVRTTIIVAQQPITGGSFGDPCWTFGRSTHQFWRGTA
jgi:hypothetical protein